MNIINVHLSIQTSSRVSIPSPRKRTKRTKRTMEKKAGKEKKKKSRGKALI